MTKKETHTIHDVEGLMFEQFKVLEDPNTTKEQKRKARSTILNCEKHIKNCNEKATNGKKYPERMKGFPDDKPMDKKLLNKLIDSIPDDLPLNEEISGHATEENPILNGVFVTDPTSKDYDKGWSTPKTMNPKSFFS